MTNNTPIPPDLEGAELIERLREQRDELGKVLVSFTPGGSEYFLRDGDGYRVDPERCQAVIRERIDSAHRRLLAALQSQPSATRTEVIEDPDFFDVDVICASNLYLKQSDANGEASHMTLSKDGALALAAKINAAYASPSTRTEGGVKTFNPGDRPDNLADCHMMLALVEANVDFANQRLAAVDLLMTPTAGPSTRTEGEDIPRDERLDYERRILAAECATQHILNDLEGQIRSLANHAKYTPDALDPKAAEILDNIANMVREIDVTNPPSPSTVRDEAIDCILEALTVANIRYIQRVGGFHDWLEKQREAIRALRSTASLDLRLVEAFIARHTSRDRSGRIVACSPPSPAQWLELDAALSQLGEASHG